MLNEFDPERAFGWIDFEGRSSVILAVSGGSDSTALLVAFKHWADVAVAGLRIICATVDHGLRPESAGEARHVEAFCQRLGIAHRTLKWTDQKPKTGLAAAAREARYALLADLAEAEGTDVVLTGHTANDQAETVHMRRARGRNTVHIRGLAGMARLTLFDGAIWIVRPFLMQERDALRESLREKGIVWIDDPSNTDERYERVRVRQQLKNDPDRHTMIENVRLRAEARRKLSAEAADLLGAQASNVSPGLFRLDPSMLDADQTRTAVWGLMLACCGGRAHLASQGDIVQMIEQLGNVRATLLGCLVTRKRDAIYIHRESRSDHPLRFEGRLFDGRYCLASDAVAKGWQLRQQESRAPIKEELRNDEIPASLVRAAALTEPELVCVGSNIETCDIKPEIHRYLAPFDHFLPEFDLTLANAAATLFDREAYPPPPVIAQKVHES